MLGWPPNDTQKPRNLWQTQPLLSLEAPSCPEHRVDCHRVLRTPAKMVPPGQEHSWADAPASEQKAAGGSHPAELWPQPAWMFFWGSFVRGKNPLSIPGTWPTKGPPGMNAHGNQRTVTWALSKVAESGPRYPPRNRFVLAIKHVPPRGPTWTNVDSRTDTWAHALGPHSSSLTPKPSTTRS